MDWFKLIIPIIALVVWIVANIVGNAQEQRRGPRRSQPKPPAPPKSAEEVARDNEEEERQQEELRRRRKAEADRNMEVERRRQAESDRERRRTGRDDRPREPAVVVPEVRRGERRTEERRVELPRPREAPAVKPKLDEPVARELPAAASAHVSLAAALGEAAQVKRSAPSATAVEVRRLLKNPTSRAAALALREILDPPLVMRRR